MYYKNIRYIKILWVRGFYGVGIYDNSSPTLLFMHNINNHGWVSFLNWL